MTAPRFVGRAIPRREDERLVRGAGRFTDDVRTPDALFAVMVRAPHVSARLLRLDADAARRAPGVVAVLTGAEYAADGGGGIAHGPVPNDNVDATRKAFDPARGHRVADVPQQVIVTEFVRHAGEIVALVIAESESAARDAVELVDAAYEVRPAVIDPFAAAEPGQPRVCDAIPENVCLDATLGDAAAAERAFADADLVVEGRFTSQRVAASPLEPRAAVALYDSASGVSTLYYGTQGALRHRTEICGALRLRPDQVAVVSGDVGGAFGARSHSNPEAVLCVWASRRLARTVRWTAQRGETFLADFTGRDIVVDAALALGSDGRICALRATATCTIGAYTVSYSSPQNLACIVTGVYDIPVAAVRLRGILTNTVPTTSYRGAGRPEAHLALERLLDRAALRLGIDRIELRRRNVIARAALPKRNALGISYDSGDFVGNMIRTMRAAEWDTFAQRRATSAARGRLRGIGLANYIESPVGNPRERVDLRVDGRGAEIVIGTGASGQGHETTFAQVAADALGLSLEQVRIVTGDTRVVRAGGGTQSNRSMRLGGKLIVDAAAEILRQAEERARGASLPLLELAAREPLRATAEFDGRIPAFPTGCAVCELEIDRATGRAEIVRYTQVDDVGQAINPLIVHGQTHGGIAQGVGAALFEDLRPHPETGEPTATSFMTYALPRATDVPRLDVELDEDPTAGNALRVKGAGEGGVTPAPAAVVSALCDALRDFGVEELELPATPERIWTAMRAARVPALAQ